ncbi:hypothetical protein NY2A_b044R [Paramecium bursaria Chlorella virus NY2A]|uniref:Uncharacterized protein b044R n=1 Tax=Paramecium bursaria Chlorella virus NY2A TaxID=46021 RepID=A7IVR9_PBCVN|nr:hypothetical protein NY2A_b044R [Paramecium bursaria Chlorella virus NY2A]ABT14443.1 hypothetical protein NY2A_b044R [Paramecium bursaria Chlorella virus NY2A]
MVIVSVFIVLVITLPEVTTFAVAFCPVAFPTMLMFALIRLPDVAMFAPPIVFTSIFDSSNTFPVLPMTLVTGKFAPVNCNQFDVDVAGVPRSMYVTFASAWNTTLPGRAFERANLAT